MNGRKPKIGWNVVGYTDRRTQDLHRRYYDIVEARRAVEQRRQIQMVQRMVTMGADREGHSTAQSRTARIWPGTTEFPFRVVRLR